MPKLHFWYSPTQKARITHHKRMHLKDYKKKFAVINGEVKEYTTANSKLFHGTNYDDIKYLGKGNIKK